MPLKIRSKLLVAFLGLIIVILAVAGIIGYYSQQGSDKAVQRIQAISEEVVATANLGRVFEHAIMPANDYLITGNRRYVDEFKKVSVEIEEELSKAKKLLDRLYALKFPNVEDERNWLNEIEVAWQNIKELSLRIFEMPDPIGNRNGAKLMEEMDYRWAGEATDLIHKWHELDTKEYGAAIGAAERVKRLSWSIMAASGAILMILGVGFAVFYSRLFVRPIEAIHNGADAIAAGNFKTRLDIKTGDEIQQLADAMNEMAEKLDSFYGTLENQVEERTGELQDERDKLIKVFETMEDGVYLVDQDYNIQYMNSSILKEFGAVEGRKCYTYFHNRTEVCPWCPNQRVFAGETVRWEWHSLKNGKTYDLLDTALRNPDGSLSKLEIFRDITDRKLAEETIKKERDYSKSLVETANAIILTLDTEGRIVNFNRYMEEISGYKLDEVKGKEWFMAFLPERDHDRIRSLFKEAVGGIPTKGNVNPILTRDGREVVIEWYANTIKDLDGRITGLLAIGQDVTERIKTEEKLKQRIDELEQFRKVTIKRELRMEELQRKVDELEKKVRS